MGLAHPRLAPPTWLRLPRRTARLRLTAVYGALFLLSGVALVTVTYVLFERATEYKTPHLPQVPRTPAIAHLQLTVPKFPVAPGPGLPHGESIQPQGEFIQLYQHPRQLAQAQQALGAAQQELAHAGPGLLRARPGLIVAMPAQLARIQHQLATAQRQLAQGQSQLADAVHQLAEVGPVQAAQRASDSHQLLVNSGVALAIVAVLALLAGWLVGGRILRPIRTITRTARRISYTSLHERLALDGPQDELKELGDTLDDLFARLDAAFVAQRQFVANASHELRAPLTRQRALIQVALADPDANLISLRTAHERVLASEQHLEQMIDGLLALTRGQAGLERRESLDLATLAGRALQARASELASLGLDVNATLAPAPTVGDPRLLERLIANLLDNALRHNIAQGHVEIATGTRQESTGTRQEHAGTRRESTGTRQEHAATRRESTGTRQESTGTRQESTGTRQESTGTRQEHAGTRQEPTGIGDQRAFLTVINSGPTIPAEELPRLLQPFQRLHGTRTTHGSGHGLGLAIVSAIATAHGATLTAQPRPGGGLTVEVTFPVSTA
jgi:signal transduction histidine kinase